MYQVEAEHGANELLYYTEEVLQSLLLSCPAELPAASNKCLQKRRAGGCGAAGLDVARISEIGLKDQFWKRRRRRRRRKGRG